MTSAPRTVQRLPLAMKSAARLGAVQALYQMDLAGTDVGEVLAQFSSRAMGENFDDGQCGEADFRVLRQIVEGVVREQRDIDLALDAILDQQWPLTRLDATVRAILRAGAYEIMFMNHVPAKAAITEYVHVAEAFFDDREPRFINGVLNRLARDRRPAEFAA